MKNQLLLIMIVGVLFSCSKDNNCQCKTVEMRINHYWNTGFTIAPVLTMLVQEGDEIGTNNWNNFYSSIEGFEYEPGNIYSLLVKKEPIANPPADGSSVKHTLIEVKSTQKVDNETPFEIGLKINGESFITNESGLKLLNQIDIDCNNLCDELETTLQNQDFVVGTFKRISNNRIQLIGLE